MLICGDAREVLAGMDEQEDSKLKKVGPGMYTLPDQLRVRAVEFSEEYEAWIRWVRAHDGLRQLVAYIRWLLWGN